MLACVHTQTRISYDTKYKYLFLCFPVEAVACCQMASFNLAVVLRATALLVRVSPSLDVRSALGQVFFDAGSHFSGHTTPWRCKWPCSSEWGYPKGWPIFATGNMTTRATSGFNPPRCVKSADANAGETKKQTDVESKR